MSRVNKSIKIHLPYFIMGVAFIAVMAGNSSCTKFFRTIPTLDSRIDTNYVRKVSWNILFNPNISLQQKEIDIKQIEDSVRNFYVQYDSLYHTDFIPQFDSARWCPCDSTLVNLTFTFIGGSGKSAPSPPSGGGIRLSGDVESISSNNSIKERPRKNDSLNITGRVQLRNIPVDSTRIFAIIDSGLDTTLFTFPIKNLLWNDPTGRPTLYNFISPLTPSNFEDGKIRHGSAVTALAINAMDSAQFYPRLMVLKAFDANDSGSAFSVGCALDYAIQNDATIVNGSFGYLGKPDTTLLHYISLSNRKEPAVQLFFAAGNLDDQPNGVCDNEATANILTVDRRFYPACFAPLFNNITSVTQLKNSDSSCHYQYYSMRYISLGILNTKRCCSFDVDFTSDIYEGSSFATPVASGLKMAAILRSIPGISNTIWENSIQRSLSSVKFTVNGKYIVY